MGLRFEHTTVVREGSGGSSAGAPGTKETPSPQRLNCKACAWLIPQRRLQGPGARALRPTAGARVPRHAYRVPRNAPQATSAPCRGNLPTRVHFALHSHQQRDPRTPGVGTGRGRRRTGPTASPPLAGALRPASPLPSPGVWGIVPCSFNFSSDSIRLSAVQMTSFPIRFWFSLTQFPFNPVRFRVHFLFRSLRVHGAATVLGSPLEAAGGWEGLALRRTLGGSRDHVTAAQEPRNRPSAMHCAPPAHSASPAHGAPEQAPVGNPNAPETAVLGAALCRASVRCVPLELLRRD